MFQLPSPPGIHNVRNAAAAAAVALALNVPADLIRAGLAKFSGVGRRFEIKGKFTGVTLIDDYGHHPAEIRATLEAARGCGYKRLLVLFQPHRYSRTQHLWEDFRRSFNQADVLVITEIYAAGEAPIDGHHRRKAGRGHQRGGPQERRLFQHAAGRHRIHAARGASGRRRADDRRRQRGPRDSMSWRMLLESRISTSTCGLATKRRRD